MPNVNRSPDARPSGLPDDLAGLDAELNAALDWVGQVFIEDTLACARGETSPLPHPKGDRRRRALLAARLVREVNKILREQA